MDDLLKIRQVLAKDESGRQPVLEGNQLVYRVRPPVELTMEDALGQLRRLREREIEFSKAADFWQEVVANWKRETAELR